MMTLDRQNLIFDLDDTLIHCNKYFIEALNQFAELMQQWFPNVAVEVIMKKQQEIDLAGIEQHGLIKDRFPLSLVETYEMFAKAAQLSVLPIHREQLLEIGYAVYDRQFEPYPDMFETLDYLQSQGHQLHLFTGGDREVQMRKVKQHCLHDFFEDRIFIARYKNTQAMRHLIEQTGSKPEQTWMIGNSAKTDMILALENGLHGIHVLTAQEWSYNHADIDVQPRGVFVKVEALKYIPNVIETSIDTFLSGKKNA